MRSNATWDELVDALERGPVMVRVLVDERRLSLMVLGWDYQTVLIKKMDGTIFRIPKNEFMAQWCDSETQVGWMMTIA